MSYEFDPIMKYVDLKVQAIWLEVIYREKICDKNFDL